MSALITPEETLESILQRHIRFGYVTINRLEKDRIHKAIETLKNARNPWLKTSERLPTVEDANEGLMVLGWDKAHGCREIHYQFVATYSKFVPWWMPLVQCPGES